MSRHTYEPYLSRKHWTADQLAATGFFDDGLSEAQLSHVLNDQRWITPTHHLKPCGVVLCTTGAFSPFHAGHLRMLEIAKAEIEERGWKVAGAYVQPDHDSYVSTKHGGIAACPASERVHQARVALQGHDWIQVDPWAALYQDRQLNYTTILERTSHMLEQLGDYQVVYVFGSDNGGFRDAFRDGEFVCVGRPGTRKPHPEALDISSTQVRSQQADYPVPTEKCPYLVREDSYWAVLPDWQPTACARYQFSYELRLALHYAVGGAYPVSLHPHEQLQKLKGILSVSFDRVTGAQHWISRVFPACALQDKPRAWVSSDLSKIPAGRYALIDDDIASGSTVAEIKRRTPQVEWTEEISMTDWCVSRPWFDIVDARDFLFGSRLGGLLVSEGFRVPYITPWVDLTSRAKIPPAAQPAFVKAVIEANVRFFEQVKVHVGQTDNPTFWKCLGFGRRQSMLEVSQSLLSWTRS